MKKKKILVVVVVILVYAAYVVYSLVEHKKIEKDGRYTIAKVIDFKENFRNGYTVYYEYSVNHHSYEESMHISEDHSNIIGKIFFAKFNPKNAKNCFIMLDKPASFDLENLPADGWTKLPD